MSITLKPSTPDPTTPVLDRPTDARSLDAAPASHRHGLVLIGIVAGLALVTLAAVVVWLRPSTPPGAQDGLDLTSYAPGGSTYTQQVPAAARGADWGEGYGPGSQTYREQVPASAH